MGSIISISAPIAAGAAGVEPAPRAEPPGAGQASELQRAYRAQCREVLDKRDDGRDGGQDRDDAEAGRVHARKKTKRKGELSAAAGWMHAWHPARDRAIALRFGEASLGDARRGASVRDAGIEAGADAGTEACAAARGAVRATGERAPGASMTDARAPHAAAEIAPPSVPTPAARAAQRTSDGIARDMAAAAARTSAMAAAPAAGVVASRSPALPAARVPAPTSAAASAASVTSAASAASASSSPRRPAAAASPGAARERVDADDSDRAGDASFAGLPRGVQPQASLHAAEPPARAHDPSRTARQRAQAGAAQADARDVRETQGTQVRYRFNSWDGRPAVELRFDPDAAPRVVNAQPSHERVQRAMEHGVERLTPGWTVEFDRQRADDDGGRSPWRSPRQEPEEDER
ncbi:BsaU protein [Burkholderia thailandensis]|uniref:SpaN/EivJ family type III secretion system needle length determinant n=1 Tax=Burkholderia thailandensis TaxID=57975 RepID=UPI0022ABE701|nr:BsaU protein [Burkholderia thailandensis]MCZ2896910.1 BsaU protein [Burkholderia thailandensis]